MVDPIRGKIGGMFTDRHRQRECRNCGQDFNQRELSPEFVSFIKRQPDSTQRAWLAVVKENALPLLCLRCERKDIAFGHRSPLAPITASIVRDTTAPTLLSGETRQLEAIR